MWAKPLQEFLILRVNLHNLKDAKAWIILTLKKANGDE
ncbi:MAG: hypothetical protein ACJAZH_000492 [Roseivirga sp.]|jgi:hypothetical protein